MTPEAERFNGWAAMLGFVAAVGGSSWCIRHNLDKLFLAFSNERKEAYEQQKVIAETLNGRLAMLGLVAAATSDLLTGHMFFGIF